MMVLLGAILIFLVVDLAGYLIHRALHSPLMGPLHRVHQQHHDHLYPPGDLRSERYRKAAGPSTVPIFVALATPPALATWLILPPWWAGAFCLAAVAWGAANDLAHTALHVRGSWIERVPGCGRLRDLHDHHHVEQGRNFGILTFWWDRLFRTLT